ncbi:MAG: hypothetical protein ACD_12C00137G0003 [uncultured bacterium]|nr:MAG: hypothetical protein ACD_12C00137G0003 [uncultured bacterium]
MNNIETVMINFYILGAITLIILALFSLIMLIIDNKSRNKLKK